MRWKKTGRLAPAAVVCAALALLTVAADDTTDATTRRDAALTSLSTAKQTLADLGVSLKKINDELSGQYRIMKSDTYRRDREQQAKARSAIQRLQQERNELWAAKDVAQLVLLQREAEFESAGALVKISELQAAGQQDSAEMRQWMKKQEKAETRALKLRREVEAAGGKEGGDDEVQTAS